MLPMRRDHRGTAGAPGSRRGGGPCRSRMRGRPARRRCSPGSCNSGPRERARIGLTIGSSRTAMARAVSSTTKRSASSISVVLLQAQRASCAPRRMAHSRSTPSFRPILPRPAALRVMSRLRGTQLSCAASSWPLRCRSRLCGRCRRETQCLAS